MKLEWLGHACFALEQDGFRIVIDPYTGVPGYPPLRTEADRVYCSHDHFDHNAASAVRLRTETDSDPFTVEELSTFHDDAGGALGNHRLPRSRDRARARRDHGGGHGGGKLRCLSELAL